MSYIYYLHLKIYANLFIFAKKNLTSKGEHYSQSLYTYYKFGLQFDS